MLAVYNVLHVCFVFIGHFAFYLNAKPNDTAQLASETMEGVEKACLELWHYSLGWSIERE